MWGSPVDAFTCRGMCSFTPLEALVSRNPDNAVVWGRSVDAFQKLYRSRGDPYFPIVACRCLGVSEDHYGILARSDGRCYSGILAAPACLAQMVAVSRATPLWSLTQIAEALHIRDVAPEGDPLVKVLF